MATQEIRKNFNENVTSYEKVLIAVLFFVWGLLTQLNDILVPFLNQIFELSLTKALLIHFTFFTTYLVAAYPAGKLIDAIGYKRGIVAALCLAGIGCTIFYLASEVENYELFLVSLVVIASSITILQIAGNGYVVLHSEPGLEASELTFAQVFNSFARVIAFLFISVLLVSLAMKLEVLPPIEIKHSLSDFVEKPYLLMAAASVLLAVLFFFSKLPELNTKNLPVLVKHPTNGEYNKVIQVKHVYLGAIAIFCYVGAEVSIGTLLSKYLVLPEIGILDEGKIMKFIQYYWAAAMAGRVFGGFFLKFVSPNKAVGVFAGGAALLTIASFLTNGDIAAYAIIGVGLFNSILFPTIFSLGISGLGHFSEEGASVLIGSIVGGAIVPVLVVALSEVVGLHVALLLPVLCYAYVVFYGLKGSKYEKVA